MRIHAKLFLLACLSLLCLLSLSCRKHQPTLEAVDPIDRRTNVSLTVPIKRDLAEIKAGGTLTVLAPYNSTSYFVYRGEPLGYEYELLQTFAEEHGIALKMVVVTDTKSLLPLLNSGEGDIAAGRLIATPEDEVNVSFSRALYRTEPALVQQESSPEFQLTWKQENGKLGGVITQTSPYYQATLEIEAKNNQGQRLIRTVKVRGDEASFSFPVNFRVESVTLDPHYLVFRWTPEYRNAANAARPSSQKNQ